MLRHLSLFIASSVFLAAPNEGGGGGGTLKEQLTDAQGKVTALEGEKVTLTGQLNDATGKMTTLEGEKIELNKQLTEAKGTITALEGEKVTLTGKVSALEKRDQATDARAREQLAANGIPSGTLKDTPGEANAADPVKLWESYSAADAHTKAHMRKEHGSKLDAAAAAFDRAQIK